MLLQQSFTHISISSSLSSLLRTMMHLANNPDAETLSIVFYYSETHDCLWDGYDALSCNASVVILNFCLDIRKASYFVIGVKNWNPC